MSTPYRTSLPEPTSPRRRALPRLTQREGMDRISAALRRFSRNMDLISARESFAHNEWMFERKLARIKKGLAY